MKKIRLGMGALLMLSAMIISDRADVILIYAFSAFLHEIGHLSAAKLLKIKIKEIKFDFSGVRICTDERLTQYKSEIALAAAGPLVNFIVMGAVLSFFKAQGVSLAEAAEYIESFLAQREAHIYGAIGFFGLSAALQGGVNLLPVSSFDGGRITYCVIASFFSERAASRATAALSAASAFVLWTVSLYLMLRMSSGLGIYVFAACIFASTLKDSDIK